MCEYHHIYSPRETVLNSLSSGFGHTILWIDTCKSKFTILPYQPSGNEGNQYQQQAHLDEGIVAGSIKVNRVLGEPFEGLNFEPFSCVMHSATRLEQKQKAESLRMKMV